MAIVMLTPEAAEQVRSLPKEIRRRTENLLNRLKDWPNVSGVKTLSGNRASWYRMRIGDYRLLFRIEETDEGEGDKIIEIIVTKIGHRKDVYED